MRKYIILLFVFIAIVGCKKNSSNPVQPSGRSGIITMTVNVYSWDTLAHKWKDTPSQTTTMKVNLSKSYSKYYSFDECYGKNWQKGQNFENMGILLEGSGTNYKENETNAINCTYDSQGYLTSQTVLANGKLSNKTVYNVNNGKILSEEDYGSNNNKKYTTVYEYDNSGYISTGTFTDIDNNTATKTTYTHDSQGYLIKQSTTYDKETYSTTYDYNSQGLLIKETSEWGSVKTYQYNSSGLVIKTIEETDNSIYSETTAYDNYCFPVEIIDEYRSKEYGYYSIDKTVIKY